MPARAEILDALLRPWQRFADPSERVYWLFLLASVALAMAMYWVQQRRAGSSQHTRRAAGRAAHPRRKASLLRYLAEPRLWWHPSSRLDYKLFLCNPWLRAALAVPWGLSAYGLAIGTVHRLDAWRGVPAAGGGWEGWQITAVYTLTLFVSWDLSRYLLHRLMHAVPGLWEIHKVHHSAQVLTPFTLFRVHPVESIAYALRGILVTGLLTGLFFHLFRRQAVETELLGVNAGGFLMNLLGGNLRHSHVWLTYGRKLEHVFISPAQHQLHHGRSEAQQRCNYGTWLSVWDWLAGSLRVAERPVARFGLARADRNHHPHRLGSALWGPLRGVGRTVYLHRPAQGAVGRNSPLSPSPRASWPIRQRERRRFPRAAE